MSRLIKEDKETLAKAARLLAAGHGEVTEAMLLAAMTEVADHYITSATDEHAAWCTSLRMFGETCYTLARFRRDRKNRR